MWSKNFENKTINSLFIPSSSGVYIISVGLITGGYRDIYVGQSENLKKRFLEHLSESETNKKLSAYLTTKKCYFRFFQLAQKDLEEAENILLSKNNYLCNTRLN